MSAQKGKLLLLSISQGGSPETFSEIAAARATSFTINNEAVEVTAKDSAGWREHLEGAGITSMSVSVSGVFKDSDGELDLHTAAVGNTIERYKVATGNGDKYVGLFSVTSYERGGEHNGEETFSATLESAGVIVFTAGA